MSITTSLLIAILILFTLNLIVLLAYIAPILTEFKLIVQDARHLTTLARNRVEKIDHALEEVASIFDIFKKISWVTDKIVNLGKKKKQDAAEQAQN